MHLLCALYRRCIGSSVLAVERRRRKAASSTDAPVVRRSLRIQLESASRSGKKRTSAARYRLIPTKLVANWGGERVSRQSSRESRPPVVKNPAATFARRKMDKVLGAVRHFPRNRIPLTGARERATGLTHSRSVTLIKIDLTSLSTEIVAAASSIVRSSASKKRKSGLIGA